MTSSTDPRTRGEHCAGEFVDGELGGGELPVNPYVALRATYGMSLGEDDFRVLLGNPRGKLMLHHAWLHGQGVVWGLEPVIKDRTAMDGSLVRDIWVRPGLAIDGLGRELHADADRCVPLDRWLDDQIAGGKQNIRGVLVAHFAECPTRLVPALADPCDVTRRRNDHSRIAEQVRFTVEDSWPGPVTTYRRVRVLLGLARPQSGDDKILAARAEVARAPRTERAMRMLEHVRSLAARDVLDLRPADDPDAGDVPLAPVPERWAGVALGMVSARLVGGLDCWRVTDLAVVPRPRQVLLPTHVLQDLLCSLAPGLLGGAADGCRDAGGPRLDSDIEWTEPGVEFRFTVSSPLTPGSQERGVEVSSLHDGERGWSREEVEQISLSENNRRVTVRMNTGVDFETVRIIIRGTGRFPLVGANGVPFAGHRGGPAGTLHDGHDAVITEWSDKRRKAQQERQHRSTS